MTRKFLVLLAAIWAFLAVQSPLLAAELALKISTSKKLALAQRYLCHNGTGLVGMTGADFGLPQQGRVFLARIRLGRETPTHVALLFTSSSKSKNQMPDELRVAVGDKIDFSTTDFTTTDFSSIEPITAEPTTPAPFQRQPQTRFTNVKFDFSHGDLQYPLTMDITLYGRGGSPQSAMWQLTTVRAGKLELHGKMVKAVLIE